jgi:hypothetical protein
LNGYFDVSGDRITISEAFRTLMACDAIDQEERYLAALQKAERFAFDGDHLLIFAAGYDAPLRFNPRTTIELQPTPSSISGDGGPPVARASPSPGLPASTTSRMCVEVAPGLALSTAVAADRIEVALAAALASPEGVAAQLDHLELEVTQGCPHGYVAPDPETGRDPVLPAVRGQVDQPLNVDILLFVVSEEDAEYLEPYGGFGRRAYESTCEGHVCWEVTTAIYLTPAVFESDDLLYEVLVEALGIRAAAGDSGGP